MTPKRITLDNSGRSLSRKCLRKHLLDNMLGLKGLSGSTALRFGSAWHGFQHGYYDLILHEGWEKKDLAFMKGLAVATKVFEQESADMTFYDDYRTLENLRDLALAYINHYQGDVGSLEIIGTEKIFEIKLEPTSQERDIFDPFLPEEIYFTGQIDLQVKQDDMPYIWDHKTTGNSLSVESQRLHRLAQLMGYSVAGEKALGFKPEGCMVSFAYMSSRKNKDGVYGKLSMDFMRVPHIFTERDLEEWRMSFLSSVRDLYLAMISNYFPMNHDSCFDYNHRCTFSPLCDMNREVPYYITNEGVYEPYDIPEGFRQKRWDVRDKLEELSL
jgi:hypothetical protein